MHTHTHIYIYFFCRLMYIYVSMYCKLLVMIMSGCGYGALCHWWLKYETQSNRVMVFILRGLIHSPYVVKLLILFFFCSNHSYIHIKSTRVSNFRDIVRHLKQSVFGKTICHFVTSTRNKSKRNRVEGWTQHANVMEYPSKSNHSFLFPVIISMRLFESDKQTTSLMPYETASERPTSNASASASNSLFYLFVLSIKHRVFSYLSPTFFFVLHISLFMWIRDI